ncbi:MAG TPA: anti-sigma factor [Verrucomicrobiae bacterium]|nr:anti-sigma factor [Verrucomicrobiae bacterium]
MNCAESVPLLGAWVDGELDPVRSRAMEEHVNDCAACRARVQSLQSLRSSLRNQELTYRAPASLRQFARELASESRAPAPRRATSWLPFWRALALGATAAVVLLLVLRPGRAESPDRLADEMVDGHIRSLMAAHLTDVTSTDQHTVKPWFDGKVDFAPAVTDFAAQGFPLVGGRLDYLEGHPVAALVYRREKHLINVFIWPVRNPAAAVPRDITVRGYHVMVRDENGFRYGLVSDLEEKQLAQLADLLGK